jgi:hypothetical protein
MSTETNATPEVNNLQKAQEIVTGTTAYAVQEVKLLLDKLDHEQKVAATQREVASQNNRKYINLFNSVEEFIKEHVKDEQVSIDDLKELAEELNIELTKSIKVTFNIKCEYEFDVAIDFDTDDITEHDFNIRISSNLDGDEVEETSESFEVEDFEVEDND